MHVHDSPWLANFCTRRVNRAITNTSLILFTGLATRSFITHGPWILASSVSQADIRSPDNIQLGESQAVVAGEARYSRVLKKSRGCGNLWDRLSHSLTTQDAYVQQAWRRSRTTSCGQRAAQATIWTDGHRAPNSDAWRPGSARTKPQSLCGVVLAQQCLLVVVVVSFCSSLQRVGWRGHLWPRWLKGNEQCEDTTCLQSPTKSLSQTKDLMGSIKEVHGECKRGSWGM